MGRTVPSFRLAAEIERSKWRQFRSYLDKKDRKTFDQMYDYFKLHSAACIPLKREEIQSTKKSYVKKVIVKKKPVRETRKVTEESN
jgi:hypothetical protein